MRTTALILLGLLAAGVAYLRRWNRQLEAALTLRHAEGGEVGQHFPSDSEARHVIVRLPHRAVTDARKIPPRYWS